MKEQTITKQAIVQSFKQLMKNNKEYCYGLSKYLAVHFKRTNKFQFIISFNL